ncbi:hypothetical protein PSI9734_01849 [Pseudidiomarina piscicola]|uniref:Surface lipoprotein assembly modifier C-terminal domain-containing protein n=1 Tax=Pseudidiomarina piscicola TaxID=2614830 RepID=A0A6S6WNH1_9GAMM|nr:surface lipoprotein assembly modifier [Pseudidiomarina piscicola]CAB0151462.1 hypothetical protein PSI9734_01849 [Pseudidiomarina piscicola]VZT40941.1 hypothetical protein PSI9734_01849 [Pseudomonas aeruginosa]
MIYRALLPIALIAVTPAASADNDTSTWTFDSELEAGYRYDSNVGLTQIDENTAQSDQATVLRGKLASSWQATDRLKLSASYQLEQENYQEFSQYDLQIQTLMGEVSYQFPWAKVGVSQHNAQADVADDDFLEFNQTSYFVGNLVGESFYWRLAHQRVDKDLPDYSQRNAEARNYTADMFWFFNQGDRFVTLGYTHENEDAVDSKFSFNGHQVRTSIHQTLQVWGQSQKLSLSLDYKDRDYESAWTAQTAARQDQITSLEGKWSIPVNDYFGLALTAKHTDSESNTNVADYNDTTAGIRFTLNF